jgi:hypothetical protein
MPIEIKITGNHTTNVLAEIQLLNEALNASREASIERVHGSTEDLPVTIKHAQETNENVGEVEEVGIDEPENDSEESELVDKSGMPWDERIHASTKTTKQDGTWKLKRGVDPSEVKKVEAELKGETTMSGEEKEFHAEQSDSTIEDNVDELFADEPKQEEITADSVKNS